MNVFCLNCNKEFKSYPSRSTKYCSPKCFYQHRTGRREVVGWSHHYKECVNCKTTDNPYHANGYCIKCYNQLPKTKLAKEKWVQDNKEHLRLKNIRYRKSSMGKAVQANNLSKHRKQLVNKTSDVTTEFIKNLWETTLHCPLCNIVLATHGRHPDGKQLDHIISLRDGGLHIRSNIRYICARCNSTRG